MEENMTKQDPFVEAMKGQTNEKTTVMATADEKETVNIDMVQVLRWTLYIVGAIFIIVAFVTLGKDLDYSSNPFNFHEKRYVGGDAYNYEISAARSAAVMVKALFWMVAGCTAMIMGHLTALIQKKK